MTYMGVVSIPLTAGESGYILAGSKAPTLFSWATRIQDLAVSALEGDPLSILKGGLNDGLNESFKGLSMKLTGNASFTRVWMGAYGLSNTISNLPPTDISGYGISYWKAGLPPPNR